MSTETESIEDKEQREEREKAWLDAKRQKQEAYKQTKEKERIDNYYNDVRIIRKNVQYFFWISIISIISTAIVLFVDF